MRIVEVEAERLCVFHLAIDHQPDGFDWLVRQFGVETACIRSKRPFATELEGGATVRAL